MTSSSKALLILAMIAAVVSLCCLQEVDSFTTLSPTVVVVPRYQEHGAFFFADGRHPSIHYYHRTRSTTRLHAFLPPGDDKKEGGLGDVATSILTFFGVVAFFASPLGGLFFALFNSLLALVVLIPLGAFVAFNVWTSLNTVSGACPNCGAPIKAAKDESPCLCFTCGVVVQSKEGVIYMANPDRNDFSGDAGSSSGGSSFLDDLRGASTVESEGAPPNRRKTPNDDVIDVEVERD